MPVTLIADLSQQIPKEWKLLAHFLGFNGDQVATFDAENNTIAEKVIAMLNAWKHKQAENATRSSLMKALVRAGRKDLAENVRTYQPE